MIEPLKKITKLTTLGLFHNEIMNETKAVEVFACLPGLKELSIDGNPVSVKVNFKYELILRFPQLETLDEEPIQDLDRDVAEQFFIQNRIPLPGQSALKKVTQSSEKDSNNVPVASTSNEDFEGNQKENQMKLQKKGSMRKSVKFAPSKVDDDGDNW